MSSSPSAFLSASSPCPRGGVLLPAAQPPRGPPRRRASGGGGGGGARGRLGRLGRPSERQRRIDERAFVFNWTRSRRGRASVAVTGDGREQGRRGGFNKPRKARAPRPSAACQIAPIFHARRRDQAPEMREEGRAGAPRLPSLPLSLSCNCHVYQSFTRRTIPR